MVTTRTEIAAPPTVVREKVFDLILLIRLINEKITDHLTPVPPIRSILKTPPKWPLQVHRPRGSAHASRARH